MKPVTELLVAFSVLGRCHQKCGIYSHLLNGEEADGIYIDLEGKTRPWPTHSGAEGHGQEDVMCIICERELWGEHRALEREFFKPCKTCKKFPGTSSEGTCYHCFAVGNTIDECPECAGKPWTEEFLEAKEEIEGPDKVLVPF
jgi:hypothetical protein